MSQQAVLKNRQVSTDAAFHTILVRRYTWQMDTIAVLTTIDSLDRAQAMAEALVKRKLAACVQISSIESVYRWQGETRREPEYRLMVKTVKKRYADVEAAIRELHTYDLPAIYAFEMTDAFAPYAEWVADNSSEEES